MTSSALPHDADPIPNEKMTTQDAAPAAAAPAHLLAAGPETGLDGSSRTSVTGDAALAEKAEPIPVAEEAPLRPKGFVWILVVIAILSSTFLFALDNTVVADVQPQIIERFNQIGKLPWLSVAFLLGAVATNLIWGKVYEQFNAKWLYIFNIFLFEVGSAICGAANSMDMLIAGRAIAGVGGAGLYVGVMTLLSVTTSTHERPMYIGLTGLTWGLGTVLGPVVGGAFADSGATWRWAFYINLVIGGLFAPVYVFFIPSFDPRPQISIKERLIELDYVGGTTIVGAFISGVMAISFGGSVYNWNSGRIIGLFVCSAVLFIGFGLQQTFSILTTPARRIFPVHFLKHRTLILLFVMTAAAVTIVFVPIYFIPLYFQFVRNDSALKAGVRLLPYVCFLVFVVVLNGVLLSKFGYYMPWYLVGGVFGLIGAALMYTVDQNSSSGRVYGYTIILAVGGGCFIQASFSVAQVKVKPSEIPLAVGFITCGQIGGATIALAIANSVFLNQSTSKIVHLLPNVPKAVVRGAIAGASNSFFKSLAPDIRSKVLHIIVDSISRVYILGITAGAMAIILSFFMKREKLFMEMGAAG